MMPRRVALAIVVSLAAGAALWYLHDPPWAGQVTSGLRQWEEDPAGVRFRWTAGRANFFIPASASEMTLPLRAVFPGPDGAPVIVRLSVDDRWLTDVTLPDPQRWVAVTVPLPKRSRRSFRRVELRVSRVVGWLNLGVEAGEPRIRD
jgi:hypothetical protein